MSLWEYWVAWKYSVFFLFCVCALHEDANRCRIELNKMHWRKCGESNAGETDQIVRTSFTRNGWNWTEILSAKIRNDVIHRPMEWYARNRGKQTKHRMSEMGQMHSNYATHVYRLTENFRVSRRLFKTFLFDFQLDFVCIYWGPGITARAWVAFNTNSDAAM